MVRADLGVAYDLIRPFLGTQVWGKSYVWSGGVDHKDHLD